MSHLTYYLIACSVMALIITIIKQTPYALYVFLTTDRQSGKEKVEGHRNILCYILKQNCTPDDSKFLPLA
jgi:hypothetical protein